jgi:ribonuclease VapC
MIVDTSAVLAILGGEPDATDIAEAIASADQRLMSAGSYLELCMVTIARRGSTAAELVDRFLAGGLIAIEPFDQQQAIVAREAFARFGRGRHKAALNIQDCMTYALARRKGLPVLCKGTDFAATDIEVVQMPSATYKLFARAMRQRKQIVCSYDGRRVEICPHVLGHNNKGEEAALTFQFGGETSKGPLQKAQFKCVRLASVRDADLRDGEWYTVKRYAARQHCVASVDLDVNPNSSYRPKRPLEERG